MPVAGEKAGKTFKYTKHIGIKQIYRDEAGRFVSLRLKSLSPTFEKKKRSVTLFIRNKQAEVVSAHESLGVDMKC